MAITKDEEKPAEPLELGVSDEMARTFKIDIYSRKKRRWPAFAVILLSIVTALAFLAWGIVHLSADEYQHVTADYDQWKAPPPLGRVECYVIIQDWPTKPWRRKTSCGALRACKLKNGQKVKTEKLFEIDRFEKAQLR